MVKRCEISNNLRNQAVGLFKKNTKKADKGFGIQILYDSSQTTHIKEKKGQHFIMHIKISLLKFGVGLSGVMRQEFGSLTLMGELESGGKGIRG